MSPTFNPNLLNTFSPPVMESRRWLENVSFPAERPLINVSQAAPTAPPPLPLRQAMAEMIMSEPESHLYGPVLGLPALRSEISAQWAAAYGGQITDQQVAITSGCNQAFCVTVSTLAQAGDAVMIPAPWYFNHKMWLDMMGIECRLLPCGKNMLPDPEQAEQLLDDKVKAILLVSPNNPAGVEYPAELVGALYDLAKKNGISLIIDETYRDFDSRTDAPHRLFQDPDWPEPLIHLYSFSKAYRLTGHRVGAIVASESRLEQCEKLLDTITICPNQLGQRAALFGMQNLKEWLAGERLEILARRKAVVSEMRDIDGWKLLGAGAYFAYLEHPFAMSSLDLAQKLVSDASVLMLPGTMFAPTIADGGDGQAERQLRIAFANVGKTGITQLFQRLKAFSHLHPLVSAS